VSRIAHGRLKLRCQPTGLRAVLEGAIETVQPLLHEKRQLFEYRLPEADVTIDADGARLTQVVANLLHNASKYTPSGGRISVRADHEAGARTVEIRVSDTGVGIAAHTLESIFTMFAQVPSSDDGAGKAAGRQDGLGIGLALARAVVTLHGGTIHATSDGIGRGAEFIVRLPTSTSGATAAPRVAANGQPRRVLRVLVVDDNRDSAESLASVLRLDRHEVFVAYGGREAVAVAERELPDLILLDIGMPDMDGYEVARVLRAGEHHAAVRIVALSGYGQPGDRDKSLAAGCDGHLVKPVSAPDLAVWLRDPASDAVSSSTV
jgi:CheY-like chemotaxis protein